MSEQRHLGLLGATGVGVGAIVGGGILALAGIAFATTGPSALVAFAANGVIALLAALTFAEMSASFPESGGTYTFAKKVLSVEAAFMVGWVVWFASIAAAVLYALGFAAFAGILVQHAWLAWAGTPPEWLSSRPLMQALALAAVGYYSLELARRTTGGGTWPTVGKVILFVILIAGGFLALAGEPIENVRAQLSPFFSAGGLGVLQAMGYTFIALQGFDLISAVGGEVKDPQRNLPRAILISLGIALLIYLPLIFLISTVGVPVGTGIAQASRADPEAVVAIAAQRFLGVPGFWLVVAAGILSMLSALQANLYAASRVAQAMARDRTLPISLARFSRRGTPAAAVFATGGAVAAIVALLSDVATAAAASSLIFLISFAMTHWTSILARRRSAPSGVPFRLPWFPLIPSVGAFACLALAVFQGLAVTQAGILTTLWLAFGVGLYFARFAPRARVVDASNEAFDPALVRLRGRSPLVLVPIANPASAESLVAVANSIAVPDVGRVLLLSVVRPPDAARSDAPLQPLQDAQAVLYQSLEASFAGNLAPETLITIAAEPWTEIGRVARLHRCDSLLLGLGQLDDEVMEGRIEELMSRVDSDVVILRASPGWRFSSARKVLVPMGGRREQSRLRARLLGGLQRAGAREICFLQVIPTATPAAVARRIERELEHLAQDELPQAARIQIVRGDDPAAELIRAAQESDLVILGLQRLGRRRKSLGTLPLRLARESSSPLILISQRG